MEIDGRIGENLVRFRGAMPQQALAEAMRGRGWKWSQATVWAVEKGERPLRLSEATHIAEILHVSLYDLLSTKGEADVRLAGRLVSDAYGALQHSVVKFEKARQQLLLQLLHAASKGLIYDEVAGYDDWIRMSPEEAIAEMRSGETEWELVSSEDVEEYFARMDDYRARGGLADGEHQAED